MFVLSFLTLALLVNQVDFGFLFCFFHKLFTITPPPRNTTVRLVNLIPVGEAVKSAKGDNLQTTAFIQRIDTLKGDIVGIYFIWRCSDILHIVISIDKKR